MRSVRRRRKKAAGYGLLAAAALFLIAALTVFLFPPAVPDVSAFSVSLCPGLTEEERNAGKSETDVEVIGIDPPPLLSADVPEHLPEGATCLPLIPASPEDLFTARLAQIACDEPEVAEDARRRTKYGTYFGDPTAEWCPEFVLWCVIQAGKSVEEDGLPSFADRYPRLDWSGGCIYWYEARGNYYRKDKLLPRCGDLIFFDTDRDGESDHTGMVLGVEYDEAEGQYYVLTIEGNIPGDRPSDRIRQRRIAWNDRIIVGYGTFPPSSEE